MLKQGALSQHEGVCSSKGRFLNMKECALLQPEGLCLTKAHVFINLECSFSLKRAFLKQHDDTRGLETMVHVGSKIDLGKKIGGSLSR